MDPIFDLGLEQCEYRFMDHRLWQILLLMLFVASEVGAQSNSPRLSTTDPRHHRSGPGGQQSLRDPNGFKRDDPDTMTHASATSNQVGNVDQRLSQLCARGLFGQVQVNRKAIYFKRDNRTVGMASGTGWNLVDTTRAAKPNEVYWFWNQGYSNCQVYKVTNPSGG